VSETRGMLDVVGAAIEKAQSQKPYGLYDYSNYPGEAPPHVVRDERTGRRLLTTWDPEEARSLFEELKRFYVADAAIKAMDQWRFAAAGITAPPVESKSEVVG
jgi:hypothetical protein